MATYSHCIFISHFLLKALRIYLGIGKNTYKRRFMQKESVTLTHE